MGGWSLEQGTGLCPFNNTFSKTEGIYLPSVWPVLREKESAAELYDPSHRCCPEAPPQTPAPCSPPSSPILRLPNSSAELLTCSTLFQVVQWRGLQDSHVDPPPKHVETEDHRHLLSTEGAPSLALLHQYHLNHTATPGGGILAVFHRF